MWRRTRRTTPVELTAITDNYDVGCRFSDIVVIEFGIIDDHIGHSNVEACRFGSDHSITRPASLVLIIVLSLVIVGGVTDLWLDGERWPSTHAIVELSTILVSTGCLVYFWRSWRDSSQEVSAIRNALG